MDPAARDRPTSRLIAVLASSFSLNPATARWLYHAAVALHHDNLSQTPVAGDLGEGVVRNLREEAILGSFGGPLFEADLRCAGGGGRVRFLVTHEGLAIGARPGAAALN